MNDIQFGNPHSLYLLAVVALGLVAVVVAALARHRAANRFASAELRGRLFPTVTAWGHWISAILISACLTLMAIACADIRWGKTWREVPQKGIELMFVLDVSRSMLAEDVSPNRLSRAKQQIKDIVDELAGDRIGLISFAGTTRQSVPLTSHYEDFKQTLDSVGPHSVRSGGSRLGDAISAAADAFISKTNQHKVIVIFTDGEDQESQPVQIATTLHDEQGIRVFTVGLGDTDQGARIPEQDPQRGTPTGGFVQYNGQQVWSKMNGAVLRQVAEASNGAYIPAGTRRVNMADVYHRFIANVPQTEFETAKINAYVARYQWFAAPALLLLLLEIGYTGLRNTRLFSRAAKPAALIVLTLTSLAPAASASAAPPDVDPQAAALNAGNALVREGKFDQAIEHFQNIQPPPPLRDQRNYNLAVAQYRNGDIAAAKSLFAEVASGDDAGLAARSRYNLGNCFYADAVQAAEQNPQAAIAALQTAIEHYRGTLRVDPQHADARANLELAANWLRELNQPQQEPPQEQPQEDTEQGEDQQDEDNQGQEQQEQQQEDQQQGQEQQGQENSGGENNEAESEPGNQEEGEGESEKRPASEGGNEGETEMENENDSGAGQLNERESEQEPQAAAPSETMPDGQSPDQDDADSGQAEPSEAPQGELTAPGPQQSEQAIAGQPADDSQGVRMTREEALKMLQAVRDRDMLRRLQHERSERSRRQIVDRDW